MVTRLLVAGSCKGVGGVCKPAQVTMRIRIDLANRSVDIINHIVKYGDIRLESVPLQDLMRVTIRRGLSDKS